MEDFTAAATYPPYLLFGLLIGAWVDRVDRKRLMIFTDITRDAVIASIPLLASLDRLPVWWIYLVTFVSTTLSIRFDSAQFAAITSIVPATATKQLVMANGHIGEASARRRTEPAVAELFGGGIAVEAGECIGIG